MFKHTWTRYLAFGAGIWHLTANICNNFLLVKYYLNKLLLSKISNTINLFSSHKASLYFFSYAATFSLLQENDKSSHCGFYRSWDELRNIKQYFRKLHTIFACGQNQWFFLVPRSETTVSQLELSLIIYAMKDYLKSFYQDFASSSHASSQACVACKRAMHSFEWKCVQAAKQAGISIFE